MRRRYRYTRLDGTAFARSSDVGFVPALKARGELWLGRSTFVGFEVDGIYAPISVLNGSASETVGAILDASLRAGVALQERGQAFVVAGASSSGAAASRSTPRPARARELRLREAEGLA